MTRGWLSRVLLVAIALGAGFGLPGAVARADEPGGAELVVIPPVSEAEATAAPPTGLSESAPADAGGLPVTAEELLSDALDQASLAASLSPPPREPGGAIERAWFMPSSSLEERVWRTRRKALERGVWNLDAAARALFASGGAPLDRAEAAVRLAPDLPASRMELARALWLHGDSPLGAIRTAASGVRFALRVWSR